MNSNSTSSGLKQNDFKPFINEYVRIAKLFDNNVAVRNTHSISIKFGKVDAGNAAECYPLTQEIIVDEKYFRMIPVESKEELIFHELWHCSMYESHRPTGIMKETGLHPAFIYRKYYKYLINELFQCETGECVDIEFDRNKYSKGKTVSKKDEILKNEHAVVRFTADWCGPCRGMKPIFEEVAIANPTVKVYVIDIDQDSETAQDFGIKAIPTLIKIVDGAEQIRTVGGQTKDKIEELFKK